MNGEPGGRAGGTRCPRTRGLIDRLVAGAPNDDDLRHAPTCRSCGPVFARAERFDVDLRRTARRLVPEDLPRGILDPRLAGAGEATRGRGPLPGLATAVAVAMALVAIGVAVRPTSPGATQSQPPLQIAAPTPPPSKPVSSSEPKSLLVYTSTISRRLKDLGFGCDATPEPSPQAPRPSAVARETRCTGPAGNPPGSATIVIGSASSGDIVMVTITAKPAGADTPETRGSLATSLAQLVELAFRSESALADAGAFVIERLPALDAQAHTAALDLKGVRVDLERLATGDYVASVILVD